MLDFKNKMSVNKVEIVFPLEKLEENCVEFVSSILFKAMLLLKLTLYQMLE